MDPLSPLPDFHNDREAPGLRIGRGTYWAPSTQFPTFTADEWVIVGRYCSLAAEVVVMTGGNHHTRTVSTWPFDNFLDGLPNPTRTYDPGLNTTLGSDVWLGHGSFVGNGAVVGHGAVIGARAVVMGDIEPYAVVVGNPGRMIRRRFSEAIVERLLAIAWWDWPADVVIERRSFFYEPVDAFVERFG